MNQTSFVTSNNNDLTNTFFISEQCSNSNNYKKGLKVTWKLNSVREL